ncbi:MAG: type II/IV secretion system ATPase subunit, partial [Thermoplasmata archaeon]|nr:type II/IV secretion system ATPase subunit [Thermoplasmata archaeon]
MSSGPPSSADTSAAPQRFQQRERGRPTTTKPKTRAELLRQSAELERVFVRRPVGSDKVLVQAELGYMRRQLELDKRSINITYPVNPPFAFVHITFEEAAGEYLYSALEPTMHADEMALLVRIRAKMDAMMAQEELPVAAAPGFEESPELRDYLRNRLMTVIDLYDFEVPERRRPIFLYYLQREFLGLGRTDAVLRDPFLEDVSCLGPNVPLYVFHRVFGSLRTNVVYESELELNKYIFRLAQLSGKHISIYQPILDSTLRDGSRINLTLGTEVTRKGSTFSVRKFSQDPVSPIDLLRFGSLSAAQLAYFWTLIENH